MLSDELCDSHKRSRESMPAFLRHYFIRQYGLKSIAMKNIANLAAGVRHEKGLCAYFDVLSAPPAPRPGAPAPLVRHAPWRRQMHTFMSRMAEIASSASDPLAPGPHLSFTLALIQSIRRACASSAN